MQGFSVLLILSITHSSHEEVIDNILESLSKGVTFFEQQSTSINLDGVVGYVILQAQLQEALKSQAHSDSLSLPQRSTAVSLLKKLAKSLSHAVAFLQKTDQKYFKEFEPVLASSFWSLPRKWRSTDPTLAYPSPRSTECYDELLSDKCMTLLLGTWKDDGTPCIVTKTCRDAMTQFGCPHYSLSHQLLYFMIGRMDKLILCCTGMVLDGSSSGTMIQSICSNLQKKKGCTRMLKGELRLSRVNITVEHYQRIFCSNMMKSNQEIVSNGFTGQIQDLFIENILLCGLTGFSDFYQLAWLQHILDWQDKELGCFGKHDDYSQMFEEYLETPHKRVKRREKTLKDGCSSHMTGVAVSAIGGYLNFYLSEQDITKRPLM